MGLVGASEAARLAHRCERTIGQWRDRGYLPSSRRIAPWDNWAYDADEVMQIAAWMAEYAEYKAKRRVPPHLQRKQREQQREPEYVITNAYSRERV